jgi:hypothetical protein
MVFEWKDILVLVAGGLLGVPASMAASLILGPAMTIMCGFGLIKILGKLRQRVIGDTMFDAVWTQDWHVVSDRFAPANPSTLRIYRFLHLIAAEAEQETTTGESYKFRILGVMDRNIITGKWMDPKPNGYYGTFQLMLAHTHDAAEGKWMGFSSSGTVKSGDWVWRKVPSRATEANTHGTELPVSTALQTERPQTI